MPARLRKRSIVPITSTSLVSAIDRFLLSCDARNISRRTIETYAQSLRPFAAFAGEGHAVGDITTEQLQRFLIQLRDVKHNKPSTIQTRYKGLHAFVSWCLAETPPLLVSSPLRSVKSPAVPDDLRRGFTDAELQALLATCQPTPLGLRDRAIMLTLYGTGLRLQELLSMRKDELRERDGRFRKEYRIMGKGKHARSVPLSPSVQQAIAGYLAARGDDDEPMLWLGERGVVTQHAVQNMCRTRGVKARVADCHPHRFRNTALAAMLAGGMDVAQVMRISGHRDLAMLQHYVNYNEDQRAMSAIQALAPVERLLGRAGPSAR